MRPRWSPARRLYDTRSYRSRNAVLAFVAQPVESRTHRTLRLETLLGLAADSKGGFVRSLKNTSFAIAIVVLASCTGQEQEVLSNFFQAVQGGDETAVSRLSLTAFDGGVESWELMAVFSSGGFGSGSWRAREGASSSGCREASSAVLS